MKLLRLLGAAVAVLVASAAPAVQNPALESHAAAQSAADVLREYTGADGAFIAAAQIKESFKGDNLASLLQYPSDELVVVSLKGSQIRQAFERSASLLPEPNTSFLQVSGFEVTYSKRAEPGQRITAVAVGGSRLEDERTYTVAMPNTLARGGLGYFKVWDKSKIAKTYTETLESVLKGKRATETAPRWLPQP